MSLSRIPVLMKKIFIVFFLLTLSLSPILAQKKLSLTDYTINFKYHYGFMIQTSIEVAQLINQKPSMLELEVLKQSTGKDIYEQVYKHTQVGASVQYLIFDPSKPLGNAVCVYPHFNFKMAENKHNQLYLRLGYGAAFVEKRFNTYDNYKDDMISSRFNFTFSGRINYYFKIKNLNVNTGLGVLHISNGVIKVPDQGLNVVTVHLGFGISGPSTLRIHRDSIARFHKKNVLFLSWAGGVNQTYPVNGPDYFQSTLSAYAGRRLNYKSTINAGFDVFFDGMNKINYNEFGLSSLGPFRPIYYFKLGFAAGHELSYKRVALLTQLGVYLYDPFKLDPPVYQRYGVKYYLSEKLFVMSALKIHFGSADFVEWTVGLRL